MFVEQRLGGDYKAGRTEAALRGVVVDKRLLYRMQCAALGKRLDGRDFLPWASIARVEQEYESFLSIITVQAPHSPRSQTRLAPVTSRSSRKASSKVTRGSICSCAPWLR